MKYNEKVSMEWRSILAPLRSKLDHHVRVASNSVFECRNDIAHNFPDDFSVDLMRASIECKKALLLLRSLNQLRAFLRYKSLSEADIGILDSHRYLHDYSDNFVFWELENGFLLSDLPEPDALPDDKGCAKRGVPLAAASAPGSERM